MKFNQKMRFLCVEQKASSSEKSEGRIYTAVKLINDVDNSCYGLLVEGKDLIDKLLLLERYQEYDFTFNVRREKYNYGLELIDVNI